MPRACSICHHPQRERIAFDLHQGTPLRQIANAYKVALTSLSRHTRHTDHGNGTEPVHAEQPVVRRPALEATAAHALREDLDRLTHVIDDDVRARYSERYLLYTLALLRKLVDALSASPRS